MVVVTVAGALLLFFATRSDEPTHGGRRLSYWLGRLWHSDDKVQSEAEAAIRSMGTNAVLHLIRMLPERDGALKQRCNDIVWKLFRSDWSRAQPFFLGGRSPLAAHALGIIGPPAREAVPFLIQNMTNTSFGGAPSTYDIALSSIGADSVLPLMQAIRHPDEILRVCAWTALSHCDTNLVLAVPELIKLAKSEDEDTRRESIRLLSFISEDSRALSTQVESLKDGSTAVRYWAVRGLAVQGPRAVSALPALMESLNDNDTNVQAAAELAIMQIDTNLVIEGTQVRKKTELRKER